MTNQNRIGSWMQTYTGIAFWPLDPRPEEIHLEDIAHSLSMQCRYAGHCLKFYSVAEHCVLLSGAVSIRLSAYALMHDAAEAYLVDVPRPIKPFLRGYKDIEENLMLAVSRRFSLQAWTFADIEDADRRILTDEMQQNMSKPPMPWDGMKEPLGVALQFWSSRRAKSEFLSAAASLGIE